MLSVIDNMAHPALLACSQANRGVGPMFTRKFTFIAFTADAIASITISIMAQNRPASGPGARRAIRRPAC